MSALALERVVRSPAALVENLPIGVYTCDRDGLLVQFNRRAAELWGRTPTLGDPRERYTGAFIARDPDGRRVAAGDSPMAQVLRSGRAVHNRELVVETERGERLTILANLDPIFDEQGTVVGGVNCFQDISELTRVKAQLREDRHVGRSFIEAIPAAIYATDATGALVSFNKAAERLWGFTPEFGDPHWCAAWRIYDAGGAALAHDDSPMAQARREKRALIGPETISERPDGTRVHVMPYPTPIFGSGGTLIGSLTMLIDMTQQKRADAQQRGLIDELNHRVKNTLATIQSLAAQTMRGVQGDTLFEGRLLALSRVHDQLTRNAWEWADFAAIADDTLARCRAVAGRVRLDGPRVPLKPRQALAMGMVLHELATNAVRHGALSAASGSVALAWRLEVGKLLIDWREQDGPAVSPPDRRGFGTRLLERSIAQELGGRPAIDFLPAGVHCTMEIPLPQ